MAYIFYRNQNVSMFREIELRIFFFSHAWKFIFVVDAVGYCLILNI